MKNLIAESRALFEVEDIEDHGLGGKQFEKTFIKALRLVGMKFNANAANGPGWDIHTLGGDWVKMISGKNVNIKVYGTKWMLSSAELYRSLPWEELPQDFDRDRAEKRIRKVISKKGIAQIYFLKPKSKSIQERIIAATDKKDVTAVRKLLVTKNFLFEKLGSGYGVRILDDGERVTSIAILKDGKVFMRSEKPRKLGGSMTVTFKAPTPKISKIDRKVAQTTPASEDWTDQPF